MDIIKLLKEAGALAPDVDETVIKSKVDEYTEEVVKDRTTGLIKNRDDLKQEKLDLKMEFDDLKTKYSFVDENEISIEVFADMKSELETYRAKGDTDEEIAEKLKANYERGKKQAEDALNPQMTKLSEILKQTEAEKQKAIEGFQNYKAESEIRKAVSKTGVQASPTWFKGLMNDAKIEFNDTGKMEVSLPYEEQGHIPLQDWIKSFPTTDEAKRMMPARIDTGSSATGGSGGSEEGVKSLKDQYNGMFKS